MTKTLGLAAIKKDLPILSFRVLLFLIIGLSIGFSGLAQADYINSCVGFIATTPNETCGSLTTSTSSTVTFTDVFLPEDRIDTFFTSLRGSINGGPMLVELDFNLAYIAPEVQAAIAQVQAALNLIANPQTLTFMDPVLLSSLETLQNSQTNFLGEQLNHSEETATLEDTIGPGTIIIGDRDNGGVAFEVIVGSFNLDVHLHTEYFKDLIFQEQNTYLTSQYYEISGNSSPTHGVPEPTTMLLLGLGLMGLAGVRRKLIHNGNGGLK